jgi:hypothetical protein
MRLDHRTILSTSVAMLIVLAACTDRDRSEDRQTGSSTQAAAERRSDTGGPTALAVQRWNVMATEVPKLLDLLGSRIDEQTHKPLTNAERDTLVTARAALADLRSGWLQAGSLFGSGQAVEAVKKGEEIERRARETLGQIESQ